MVAIAAVDHTQHVVDDRAALAQLPGRQHDLTAGRDDVFDNEHPLASDLRPSASFAVPYDFGSLRTNAAGNPAASDSAVATGTPPSSRPARTSVPAGTSGSICCAMSRRIAGSPSKRYLSK